MTGIRIIAKTEAGRAAILQHQEERKSMPWHQRTLFNQLYRELVEREEPLTITLEHKKEKIALALPFESLRVPVVEAMTANGAALGIDYEVERL